MIVADRNQIGEQFLGHRHLAVNSLSADHRTAGLVLGYHTWARDIPDHSFVEWEQVVHKELDAHSLDLVTVHNSQVLEMGQTWDYALPLGFQHSGHLDRNNHIHQLKCYEQTSDPNLYC